MTSQSSPDIVALADEIEDSYSGNFVQDILLDEKDRKLIVAALRARSSAGSAIALADELQQYIDNYPGGPPKHFLLKLHAALSAPAQPSAGRAHPADCACDRCQGRPLSRSRSPALAQPSAGIGEPVAWQFRQRSGVGKGPQSQAPWGDWCGIEREDYERYTREPNPLIQVRPLYTGAAQPSREAREKEITRLATIEECARLADGWLAIHGDNEIQYTSAREYASDAVADIADAIRGLAHPSTNHHTPQEK